MEQTLVNEIVWLLNCFLKSNENKSLQILKLKILNRKF